MLPKQQMPKAHRSESENKPPKRKWKQAIKKKSENNVILISRNIRTSNLSWM